MVRCSPVLRRCPAVLLGATMLAATGRAAGTWPALSWLFHVRRVGSPRRVRVPGRVGGPGAGTLSVARQAGGVGGNVRGRPRPAACRVRLTPCSIEDSTARDSSSSTVPALVSRTPSRRRCSNGVPTITSSRRICWLSVGWAMNILRCVRERARAGNRDEVTQVPQLHALQRHAVRTGQHDRSCLLHPAHPISPSPRLWPPASRSGECGSQTLDQAGPSLAPPIRRWPW